jgi:putative endonuclease
MQNKRKIGDIAETIACNYLQEQGYTIIDRNYFIFGGEIDIIASYNNKIIFVEVKSLSSEKHIMLEQSISKKKRKALIKTCNFWIYKHHKQYVEWRIDFLGLIIKSDKSVEKVNHIIGGIF